MPHPGPTPSLGPPRRRGGRPGGLRLAAALGLVVLAAGAADAPDPAGHPVLRTRTLWDGQFIPGGTTEVCVELLSHTGGEARVSLRSGPLTLTARATLTAGRTSTLALPLRPAPTGRVEVAAEWPDGTRGQVPLALRPRPDQAPLSVASLAAAGPSPEAVGLPPATRVAPADLPRTAEGYGPVARLSLRPADLAALDAAQTAALGHYLADCRPLQLSHASDLELAQIRGASGCHGRGVSADVDAANAPGPATADATGVLPPWLRSLPERDDRRPLALLLLPYGLVLAALLWARHLGLWVLAIPGTAAILVWLALPYTLEAAHSSTWIDAQSDDLLARFVAHLETHGQGRPAVPIALPVGSTLPLALDGGPVAVDLAEAGRTLAGSGPLLQRRRYLVHGITAAPARGPVPPGSAAGSAP